MRIYILIIALLALSPTLTFASTSKSTACGYANGVYEESLETTGLKRASVEEFHRIQTGDYDVLWYTVRQSGMYNLNGEKYDDYSVYEYNCHTKKPRRVLWQITFRAIVSKIPSNKSYQDARLTFIGGNYLNVGFSPPKTECKKDNCDGYDATIWLSRHQFSITQPSLQSAPRTYRY